MAVKNLAAYTACSGAHPPPFISINEVSGGVGFSIRQPAKAPGVAGDASHVVVERSLAVRLLKEALRNLGEE